jgi:hypothetical protein
MNSVSNVEENTQVQEKYVRNVDGHIEKLIKSGKLITLVLIVKLYVSCHFFVNLISY